MAEYELIATVFAAIIVAAVFVFGTNAIASEIVHTRAELKTSEQELSMTAAMRLVDGCFRQGNNFIHSEFLNSYEGDSICKVCGFCTISIKAKVRDLETEKEWSFGYSGISEQSKDTFINIKDGEEIHAGRLYAEI